MPLLNKMIKNARYITLITGFLYAFSTGNVTTAQTKEALNLGLNRNFINVTQIDTTDKKIKNIGKYFIKSNEIINNLEDILEAEKKINIDSVTTIEVKFLYEEAKNVNLQIDLALEVRKNLNLAFGEIVRLKDENLKNAYADSAITLIKYCDELITYVTQYEASKFYFSLIQSSGLVEELTKTGKILYISKSKASPTEMQRLLDSEYARLDKDIRNQISLLKRNGLSSASKILINMWDMITRDIDSLKKGEPPIHKSYFSQFY